MLNVDSRKKGNFKKTLMSLIMVLMMGLVFSSCFSKKEKDAKTTEKTATETKATEAAENKAAADDKTSNNLKDPVETYVKSMFDIESSYDMSGTYDTIRLKDAFLKEIVEKNMAQTEEEKEGFELAKLILENMTVDFRFVVDFNKKTLFSSDMNFGFNYKGNRLVSLDFFFDNWVVALSSREIYPKGVYLDLKTLASFAGGLDLNAIDFGKYVDVFSKEEKEYKEIDFEKYHKALYEALKSKVKNDGMEEITILSGGKDKKINANRIKIDVNTKDMTDTYIDIINMVKKDENLKKYVIKKVSDLYEVYEEDELFKDVPKDDRELKEMIEEIEKNWEKNLDEAIVKIKENLKDVESEVAESTMYYSDDSKLLVGITKYEDKSMGLNIKATLNEYEKNYNYDRLGIQSKGVNLLNTMMAPNLLTDIENDTKKNAKENIYGSKAYQEIIKDIKASTKISEATKVMIIDSFESAFEF